MMLTGCMSRDLVSITRLSTSLVGIVKRLCLWYEYLYPFCPSILVWASRNPFNANHCSKNGKSHMPSTNCTKCLQMAIIIFMSSVQQCIDSVNWLLHCLYSAGHHYSTGLSIPKTTGEKEAECIWTLSWNAVILHYTLNQNTWGLLFTFFFTNHGRIWQVRLGLWCTLPWQI